MSLDTLAHSVEDRKPAAKAAPVSTPGAVSMRPATATSEARSSTKRDQLWGTAKRKGKGTAMASLLHDELDERECVGHGPAHASLDSNVSFRVSSDIIRQQESILEMIQAERERSRSEKEVPEAPDFTSLVNRISSASIEKDPADEPSLEHFESLHVEGRRYKLLPKTHVQDALDRGDTTIKIKCNGCQRKLLATIEGAASIYCPACGTLASKSQVLRQI